MDSIAWMLLSASRERLSTNQGAETMATRPPTNFDASVAAAATNAAIAANSGSERATTISLAQRRELQQTYFSAVRLDDRHEGARLRALQLLLECLRQDPGNLVYVQAFCENLKQGEANERRRPKVVAALLRWTRRASFHGRRQSARFQAALADRQWRAALESGAGLLSKRPGATSVLCGMAEAAAGLGFFEVELHYLETAFAARPDDPAVNRHFARTLQRLGLFARAADCWTRVLAAAPEDDEARRMIAALPPAIEPPPEPSSAPDGPWPDLNACLAAIDARLADRQADAAERLLRRAGLQFGDNLSLRERWEETSLVRHRTKIEVARRLAESTGTPEAQRLIERLNDELNRLEMETFDARSQRRPHDLELRFQLAVRMKRAGLFAEAQPHFEAAAVSPALRGGAWLEIGECRQRRRQFSPALEAYREAISCTNAEEQADLRKLALYRAAVLATAMQQWGPAIDWLTDLVALDSTYKDGRDRLDKIRQIRDKG